MRARAGLAAALGVLVMGATGACGGGACGSGAPRGDGSAVTVGSKAFTESVILGELAAQLAGTTGSRVAHRRALGGTRVVWQALLAGEVDVYAEYTGTIAEELLGGVPADEAGLRAALAARGIVMGAPVGFDNTYAIGMRADVAERRAIRRLSDLRAHPDLRLGLSNEFMDRADGWPGVRDAYGLPQHDARGLDHDLALRALQGGTLDATDLYSTDAEIRAYGLRVLEDDAGHFPRYRAVLLWRADLAARAPAVVAALRRLEGAIDERAMIGLNAKAKLDRVPETEVAAGFLRARLGIAATARTEAWPARLVRHARDHLALVGVSLAAAIIVAVPLGVLAACRPRLGAVVLGVAGVMQTIPSLAMLVFMIPLLGIGAAPAIAALFLYGLLPIVRNTTAGLRGIPPSLREAAAAIGLPAGARLRRVELPLAAPAILAGIKTAAVINVGTATVGALIGAGGFGQPILTGIRLDDLGLILEGAVPAAALALLVQGAFDLLERWVVPGGLRLGVGE